MPLETGTTISALNASNPAASDSLGQADDHIRLIKAVLKATFPNFTGSLESTEEEIDTAVAAALSTGSSALLAAAGSFFDDDLDTGIEHPAANQVALCAGGTNALVASASGVSIPGTLSVGSYAPTSINGCALTGTFTGTPTFSGTPSFSNGAGLTGTFSGNPTFSGTPTFSAGAGLAGTYSGTPTFSGNVVFSGNPSFTGSPTFSSLSAPGIAKAAAQIQNSGGSYSILSGAHNVSGVTKNSTGVVTVTFSSALANANYAPACTVIADSGSRLIKAGTLSTSSFNVYLTTADADAIDCSFSIVVM